MPTYRIDPNHLSAFCDLLVAHGIDLSVYLAPGDLETVRGLLESMDSDLRAFQADGEEVEGSGYYEQLAADLKHELGCAGGVAWDGFCQTLGFQLDCNPTICHLRREGVAISVKKVGNTIAVDWARRPQPGTAPNGVDPSMTEQVASSEINRIILTLEECTRLETAAQQAAVIAARLESAVYGTEAPADPGQVLAIVTQEAGRSLSKHR